MTEILVHLIALRLTLEAKEAFLVGFALRVACRGDRRAARGDAGPGLSVFTADERGEADGGQTGGAEHVT